MARRPQPWNPHVPSGAPRPLDGTLAGRPVRRRDFLNGILVGASGALGAGASGCGPGLPPAGADAGDDETICHQVRDGKTWEIPAPSGELLDCIVIGGGLSGLTAAHVLRKRGAQGVLVLEKEEPGGYAKLDGPAASPWGQGSAYTVFPYNDNLFELYTDLGIMTGTAPDGTPVLDEAFVIGEPTNNSFLDGAWYPDPWNGGIDALPLSTAAKEGLKAFRDDMVQWYSFVGTDGLTGFDTPTDASTADADVRALDQLSLAEYAAQKGWPPDVAAFYAPYCRSAFGCEPEELSAWAAINFFGSEFQPALSRPGGNAYLAGKLVELVGAANVRTGAFVIRAVNDAASGEVHVSVLDGDVATTLRARTAIYAGPRFLATRLLPDLVAAGRDEAKDFRYTPYLVAAVHVSATPAGLGYDNWIQEKRFFTDVIVADWAGLDDPAGAPLARPNTLSCYCPQLAPGARSDLLTTPFEVYEEQLLADLELVFPGIRGTITGVDLYRWGHAMLTPLKGFVFGASRVGSQAPEGRISFANHDVDGLPAFENAVGSAFRAAGEVLALLGL